MHRLPNPIANENKLQSRTDIAVGDAKNVCLAFTVSTHGRWSTIRIHDG